MTGCCVVEVNAENARAYLDRYLRESAEVMLRSIDACAPSLAAAAALVVEAFRSNGRLLLCGNGGSAD